MFACESCAGTSRRGFLRYAAAGLAAGALRFGRAARAAGDATKLSADDSLAKLKEGNARYLKEPQLCQVNLTAARAANASGQAPWATIVACSDSRAAPEIIFGGVDLGELFVARNAGNVVDVAVMGTIEYGAEHLGSPLIVVLGHQKCGAVAAACAKNVPTPTSTMPIRTSPRCEDSISGKPIVATAIAPQIVGLVPNRATARPARSVVTIEGRKTK